MLLTAEPKIERVIMAVSNACEIDPALIKSPSRKGEISLTRQIVMYVIWMKTPFTLEDIGNHLGDRMPATISHGIQNIQSLMQESEGLKAFVDSLLVVSY